MTQHKAEPVLDIASGEVPKRVLVMTYFVVDWVYERIIPYMRNTYGTSFVFIVPKVRVASIQDTWCGPNDKVFAIEDAEVVNASEQGKELAEEMEIAREQEAKLDISYMRDIVQPDRELSTGFLSNAPWSPAAALKIPDSDDLVCKINRYMAFAESIFEQEKFDLALVWPLGALEATIATLAEGKGIPVSYPHVSSRKSLVFWSSSAFLDDSQHKAAFEKMPECDPVPVSEVVPPATITAMMSDLDRTHSISFILREIARLIFHRLEFLILDIIKLGWGFRKRRYVSLRRNVSHWAYKWRFYKKIGILSERNIDAFNDKPFIYYGLSIEPEFSVQVKSKEFNNQAAIIRQIALTLPAGYELVIKEHSILGFRDLSFYEELLKFPNVRMAHPSIRGVDLANKARAVATLVGSVTLEATLLGKPVIEFSTHSLYSFLPNVTTVLSMHDLPAILRNSMKQLSDEEKDKIRRDGARILKAVESVSFNGEGTPIFRKNDIQIDEEGIARMASLLIALYQDKKSGLKEKHATFP